MTDHSSPVTEDELHAFIDGELPADRLDAVEAWLSSHPQDAALVAIWRAQADSIRARYGAVVDESIPERLKLDRLLRNGKRWRVIATAAAVAAFLIGGIAGWVARDASAGAPSGREIFTAEALDAHRLYVVEVRHPVEVPGTERAHLVQWLSKRLGYQLWAPELEAMGLKLVGGRLLPGPSGASAFFMYESHSGERYTLYCGRANDPETALRYHADEPFAAFYWVDREITYVISGPADREKLLKVAKASYDQIETSRRSTQEMRDIAPRYAHR